MSPSSVLASKVAAKAKPLPPFSVRVALRQRHEGRDKKNGTEWAYLEEIRNGVGFTARTRTADALAMSLWPSRGLEIHGFEIKESRADWVRELKEPEKAEEIFRFCDRWWLAVGDAAIVRPGELPPTWGLLVPDADGAKLVEAVPAPKLEPQFITRTFLGALLRKTCEVAADEKEIRRRTDISIRAREAELKADFAHQHRGAIADHEELRRRVAHLEEALGVPILTGDAYRWRYDAWQVGAALKVVLEGRVAEQRKAVEHLLHGARRIAAEAEKALAGGALEPLVPLVSVGGVDDGGGAA